MRFMAIKSVEQVKSLSLFYNILFQHNQVSLKFIFLQCNLALNADKI